jgi:hypothetical protein
MAYALAALLAGLVVAADAVAEPTTLTGLVGVSGTTQPCTDARVYVWRMSIDKDANGNSSGFTIEDIWTAITDLNGRWTIVIPDFVDGQYAFSSDPSSSFIRSRPLAKNARKTLQFADEEWLAVTCTGQQAKAKQAPGGGLRLRNGRAESGAVVRP